MANQIQGLPPGAIVGPSIQQSAPQVEGLPPGAIVGPTLAPSAPLTEQDAASGDFANNQAAKTVSDVVAPTHVLKPDGTIARIGEGIKQSMPVQTAAAFLAPPQTPREHIIHSIGQETGSGDAVLGAYRLAKGVIDSAENMFTMPDKKKSYDQLKQDTVRAVRDFYSKDYRNLASDLVSGTADLGATITPGSGTGAAGRVRELSEGARQGGNLTTPLVKDVIDAGTLKVGESAPELVPSEEELSAAAASRQAEQAKAATPKVSTIDPDHFVYKEKPPAPQHGTPVEVESPLDRATIAKQVGGKDLSKEAIDTLHEHVGDTIPVGSTAKNRLVAAVEPVAKAIDDGVTKMNEAVKDAKPFTTSVGQDNVFGEGTLTTDLEKMKQNLPKSEREKLSADVDDVLEDADKALNSHNPAEVLEERRKLGNRIDWDAIEKNPSTAGEAQNAARARVYRALTDKIHDELPDTVEIDKDLQPNLELRSHLKKKVGENVFDDPHASTVEAQQQHKYGKDQQDVEAHNEVIAKNRKLAGLEADDTEATVGDTDSETATDKQLDQNVAKIKVPKSEEPALRDLLSSSVKPGRLFGTNTSWLDSLKKFNDLSPAERSARFSDPQAVGKALRSEATKQAVKAVVKYGSIPLAAHALGIDKTLIGFALHNSL